MHLERSYNSLTDLSAGRVYSYYCADTDGNNEVSELLPAVSALVYIVHS